MTKNRKIGIGVSLFAILLVGLLVAFKNRPSEKKAPRRVIPNLLAMHKASETNVEATPSTPESAGKEPVVGEDPDIKCWEKISAQFPEGDFLGRNKSFLDGFVGAWAYTKGVPLPNNEASTEGKFFLALAKANLYGKTEAPPNFDEALALLQEVSRRDPGNSAPVVIAALIAHQQGNQAQADLLMKQAEKFARFDTFRTSFYRALLSRVESSSDLLEAYSLYLPLTIYRQLGPFMKKYKSQALAHQMMKEGLSSESDFTDLTLNLIEYSMGKGLADRADPKNKFLSTSDFRDLKEEKHQVTGYGLVAELRKSCDVNTLEPMVAKVRSHYR